MENILYLANTPVTNSVRRYQPISYLVHDGAQGGIVVSPDLLFLNYYWLSMSLVKVRLPNIFCIRKS